VTGGAQDNLGIIRASSEIPRSNGVGHLGSNGTSGAQFGTLGVHIQRSGGLGGIAGDLHSVKEGERSVMMYTLVRYRDRIALAILGVGFVVFQIRDVLR
jgi:hypothetical protein